jgi:predicted RNase H-like nuclease (RuvC/YqgF family)
MKYDAFTRDELISIIELRDGQIIEKSRVIGQFNNTITELNNNLSLKNDRIQELEMTVKDIKAQRDAMDIDANSIIAHKEGVIRDLKIKNECLAVKIRSKDFQIDFLKSKVDWLSSRVALKETKESEVKLCDGLNLIEKRLNALENYIFGGNKND